MRDIRKPTRIEMTYADMESTISHQFNQQKPTFDGGKTVSIDLIDGSGRDEVLLTLSIDDARTVRDFLMYVLRNA